MAMQKPFHIAWSFILIPRFFGTILLFPCLLSFAVVGIQVLMTKSFEVELRKTPNDRKIELQEREKNDYVRSFLLQTDKPLPPITVCRWKKVAASQREEAQNPQECPLQELDLVVRTKAPLLFPVEEYVKTFSGNFYRLHLCSECNSSIVITADQHPNATYISTISGFILLGYSGYSEHNLTKIFEILDEKKRIDDLIGTKYFLSKSLSQPIPLEELGTIAGIILNVAVIIIVSLWLALRAHRRVLEYFSASGALLPLVASIGPHSFYAALWIITLARVFFFLIGSIPLWLFTVYSLSQKNALLPLFFEGNRWMILGWVVSLSASLALASLVSSIADLKRRHHLLTFLYRYLPILLCSIGVLLWGITIILPLAGGETLRWGITVLPLLGAMGVLSGPLFPPPFLVIVLHGLLSILLLLWLSKRNARWFAAHLEDL